MHKKEFSLGLLAHLQHFYPKANAVRLFFSQCEKRKCSPDEDDGRSKHFDHPLHIKKRSCGCGGKSCAILWDCVPVEYTLLIVVQSKRQIMFVEIKSTRKLNCTTCTPDTRVKESWLEHWAYVCSATKFPLYIRLNGLFFFTSLTGKSIITV